MTVGDQIAKYIATSAGKLTSRPQKIFVWIEPSSAPGHLYENLAEFFFEFGGMLLVHA